MIVIDERTFLQRRKLYRPFSYTAEVTSRSYSLPLQRVITDFGSDVAFNMISNKLSEHYGTEVPESSAQKITEKHAEKIKEKEDLHGHVPKRIGEGYLICQTDGTMVPIVETCEKDEEGKFVDKRKTRSVCWKEGRLTLARQKGRKDYVFGGTLG